MNKRLMNKTDKSRTFEEDKEIMSLDEAIEHCVDVFESTDCDDCALEHLQLADWLTELKEYREKYLNK